MNLTGADPSFVIELAFVNGGMIESIGNLIQTNSWSSTWS